MTGKEGVKNIWGFPLLLFVILFKGLNLNLQLLSRTPSGFINIYIFFILKMKTILDEFIYNLSHTVKDVHF